MFLQLSSLSMSSFPLIFLWSHIIIGNVLTAKSFYNNFFQHLHKFSVAGNVISAGFAGFNQLRGNKWTLLNSLRCKNKTHSKATDHEVYTISWWWLFTIHIIFNVSSIVYTKGLLFCKYLWLYYVDLFQIFLQNVELS